MKNSPLLRSEENQRPEFTGLSRTRPGKPLLDETRPQIGIDLTAFGTRNSLTKHGVGDFLLSSKFLKPAVFENSHASSLPTNI